MRRRPQLRTFSTRLSVSVTSCVKLHHSPPLGQLNITPSIYNTTFSIVENGNRRTAVALHLPTFARSALPSFVEKGDRRRGDGG